MISKGFGLNPRCIREFADMVSKQLDESLAEVPREVAEKLARAKDDFRLRYAGLDSDQLETLVDVIEAGYKNKMDKYYDELVGSRHRAPGSNKRRLRTRLGGRLRDGMAQRVGHLIVTLTPATFLCNVCGLNLKDPAELKAAGFPDSIDIEDVDPADFYEGPDY